MRAVVMAGGEGTRLRPLTTGRPKPLVPVMNRPIMEHIFLHLKSFGITEIVVTLYYLADEISGYFGDGSSLGVKLIYSIEESPLGTAGAVKQCEKYLKDDSFVIVSGDALTDARLDRAINFHRTRGSMATLMLARVPNPLEFGVVITNEDGHIERFLEKPDWSNVFSDTVNTGMYVLEPEVFDLMEPNKNTDWSSDVFPKMLEQQKPLYGYVLGDDEYWCDIGNLEQYREAHEHIFNGRVKLSMNAVERSPGVWVEPGVNIQSGVNIEAPVYIGKQSIIKRGAHVGPYTVVGENSIIEEQATVERSVLWGSVYAGKDSHITSSVIGSHSILKRETIVREGCVVGDRVTMGAGSTLRAGLKIWPDKYIEQGAVVTMSLIWGRKWQGSLFRSLGVQGITNIELTPDFASKLAASYGASLRKGSTVLVSRDSHRASRMIKHAVLSGLLSMGLNVIDLRTMPVPIARHYIRVANASGGVNIRISPNNPRVTVIEFFDKNGVYLNKQAERKIESIFFREDFARTDANAIGELEYDARTIEQYQADFSRHIESRLLSNSKYRIVVDFAFHRMASILPSILGRLDCDVIALNAYSDPERAPHQANDRYNHIENLSQIVNTLNADMGVLFESDGERMVIVTPEGVVLSDQQLFLLYAQTMAKAHKKSCVVAPVYVSSMLEILVGQYGGSVVRSRSDIRDIHARALASDPPIFLASDGYGGFILPQFQSSYDALFAFTKLLELLARAETTLQEQVAALPSLHVRHETVRCPWEQKGKVMRLLTQQYQNEKDLNLLDGIKVYNETGWDLILPDAFDPLFHVWSEDMNDEDLAARNIRACDVVEAAINS